MGTNLYRILIFTLITAGTVLSQTTRRVDSLFSRKAVTGDSIQVSNLPDSSQVGQGEIRMSGNDGIYYLYEQGRVRLDTPRGATYTSDVTINIDTATGAGLDTIKVDTLLLGTLNDLNRVTVFYGDGYDGAYVLDGSTQDSVAGFFGKSGSTYTLERDAYFDSLQVDSAIVFNTGGYRLFVKSYLLNYGTIMNDGNAGNKGDSCDGVNGGGQVHNTTPMQGWGYLDSTGSGGAGMNGGNAGVGQGGNPGNPGQNVDRSQFPSRAGGIGGWGGDSDCGDTGGHGGIAGSINTDIQATFPTAGGSRDLVNLLWSRVYTPSTGTWVKICGSASAGGGGGGAGGSSDCLGGGGGSGGGNGGWVVIAARIIDGSGTISSDGGIGGDGAKGGGTDSCVTTPGGRGGGGGGGGGGGAGGYIVLISNMINDSLSIHATGAVGGSGGPGGSRGGNSGTSGSTGEDGYIWQFELIPDIQPQ